MRDKIECLGWRYNVIIGHLPSGYVLAKLISRKIDRGVVDLRLFVVIGVIGAVIPDLDMLYFHIIDNRQHHHHTYWSHYPMLWISLLAAGTIWYRFSAKKSKAIMMMIFSVCGCLHMLLDSIVGDIWWLAPFIDKPFAIFSVQATYSPWWLNFIVHWSFALELGLWFWAIVLWRSSNIFRKNCGRYADSVAP